MLMILPVMYLMNQIDWTQPQNVLYARVLYGLAQACILGFCAYIFMLINKRKDQTMITVPQPAQLGTPAGPDVEQTVQDYDLLQLRKYASQVLFGAAMVVFFHYKWGMIQPLFVQTVMTPMQLYRSPLFQIFVVGQRGAIERRPFREEPNPLAAALGGQTAESDASTTDAASTEPTTPAPAASSEGSARKRGKAKRTD